MILCIYSAQINFLEQEVANYLGFHRWCSKINSVKTFYCEKKC